MNDRLTKEQAREFMTRSDKDRRRPQLSQDQMRRELGRDLIEMERTELQRRRS